MTNSQAYLRLRQQTQANFDFAVLVCSAVPQLKHAIKQVAKDPNYLLLPNEHFPPSEDPNSSEKRVLPHYKSVLGTNFFLSSFSFFESYVFGLIDEMIEFHGGTEQLQKYLRKRLAQPISEEHQAPARKLQKQHKKEHTTRYQKISKQLSGTDFIWPTDKFALYGLQQLLANRKKMKSADIPDIVSFLFLLDLPIETRSRYHNLRSIRNEIAHGKKLSFELVKAIEGNQFLYKLATQIDRHVVQHFFIIENYR